MKNNGEGIQWSKIKVNESTSPHTEIGCENSLYKHKIGDSIRSWIYSILHLKLTGNSPGSLFITPSVTSSIIWWIVDCNINFKETVRKDIFKRLTVFLSILGYEISTYFGQSSPSLRVILLYCWIIKRFNNFYHPA